MKKNWIIVMALAGILVVPAVARAHEGHAHKVMGTVSSVEGNNVMVKTADGKTVMVMLDTKTAITRGKTKLDAAAVKVGDRVVYGKYSGTQVELEGDEIILIKESDVIAKLA